MKRIILSAALVTGLLFFIAACNGTKKITAPSVTASSTGINQLTAGNWKLTELEGVSILADSKAMLSFTSGEKNTVTGNAGCNSFAGSFQLADNNTIKFSPLATTRMACFDAKATETETKFLAALGKLNKWGISDNSILTLYTDNIVLMRFVMK
jgi:heat shock protein HslJ